MNLYSHRLLGNSLLSTESISRLRGYHNPYCAATASIPENGAAASCTSCPPIALYSDRSWRPKVAQMVHMCYADSAATMAVTEDWLRQRSLNIPSYFCTCSIIERLYDMKPRACNINVRIIVTQLDCAARPLSGMRQRPFYLLPAVSPIG